MRAVCYPRVSSLLQRDKHTIDSQISTLPAFVEARGWKLVRPARHYADDGRSAKSGQLELREGFRRLTADAAAGVFDVVVVVDMDRVTRSEDIAERGAILGAFQRANVKIAIASTGQVLDLNSPMDDLLAGLQANFAATWVRQHREKCIRGRLEAIKKGRKPPGATPYGWDYSRETGVWSLHPEQAPVVVRIYEGIAAGKTLYRVQCELQDADAPRPRDGRWTREGIRKLVRNTGYRGDWIADQGRNLHMEIPRIVSDELWHAANDTLASRRNYTMPRSKRVTLCEGLAFCESCGGKMWVTGSKAIRRYTCGQKHKRVRDLGGAPRCPNPSFRVEVADVEVWRMVQEVLNNPALFGLADERRKTRAVEAKDWAADIAGFERHLARLQRAEENVLAMSRRGKISQGALERELDKIAGERRLVEHNRDVARQQAAKSTRRAEETVAALDAIRRLRTKIDKATPERQRELVRLLHVVELGDRITMGPSGIRLYGALRLGAAVPIASSVGGARSPGARRGRG